MVQTVTLVQGWNLTPNTNHPRSEWALAWLDITHQSRHENGVSVWDDSSSESYFNTIWYSCSSLKHLLPKRLELKSLLSFQRIVLKNFTPKLIFDGIGSLPIGAVASLAESTPAEFLLVIIQTKMSSVVKFGETEMHVSKVES